MDDVIDIQKQVPPGIMTGIIFNVLTEADAEKLSVLSIDAPAGVTDPKLGLPNPTSQCGTCGSKSSRGCEGHFGFINFPYTILHPYFISEVVHILNKICPGCKSIRRERRAKSTKGTTKRDQYMGCKYCMGKHPYIRFRVSTSDLFKKTAIVAELTERSTQDKLELDHFWDFIPKDINVEESVSKNRRVLSHAQVHHLLKDVDQSFIKEFVSRLDLLFLDCFLVTPNCHRVNEIHSFSSGGLKIIFDDRTRAFRKLVDFKGNPNELASRVLDCLKHSKLRLEKSKDDPGNTSVDANLNASASKWMKEVVLTKRSDHIIRAVVTGDPYLKLYEIGIPCYVAERLQISDHLNSRNWEKLIAILNLRLIEKGEFYIRRKGELVPIRDMEELQLGDLVFRPLNDGDIMLVNRPPSIHQHSMLGLYVKILPINSVVSINPLCCSPLHGDFDGDCLHGYVPQSMEARVELRELVGLDRQLRNGQTGGNLISLTHDSLTAAHLLMAEGDVLAKPEMQQLEMFCPRHCLSPAIRKSPPTKSGLWTGKQLFSLLLPQDFDYCSPSNDVLIRKGEILMSPPGSSWLRGDEDGNFFEALIDHCAGGVIDYIDAAQRVLCEWVSARGLSVSLLDLYLCTDEHSRKNLIGDVACGLEEAERTCNLKLLMVESNISFLIGSSDENQNIVPLEEDKVCYEKQKSAALTRTAASGFKFIFRDIQNMTYNYADSGNSLLLMIKSGSKGSLPKIVQQSMCVGLQHSLIPLSFRLPPRLTCDAWNELKTQNSCVQDNNTPECGAKSFIPFAVVKSSFLEGLNPLECFVHSVTSRESSFSENADVPGTLTRKLSFFLRDIVVAYDGTVRNAYGDQLVQFSYAAEKISSRHDSGHGPFAEQLDDCNGIGGHAVGALAASALSEAAYSALDQPISILEPSPLLTFKKLLESGSRKSKGHRTASLYLSDKLRRLRYGLEYGALEVKNHLEKLMLSDIVSTILIVYSSGHPNSRTHTCPWVCHFHVYKEVLKKERLKMMSIIDAITKGCEETTSLANVQISCKNGCLADVGNKSVAALCITATISESARNPCPDLDAIQNVVIPSLLGCVVKGFREVEKVDILWNDQPIESRSQKNLKWGELYLSVTLSSEHKCKASWSRLMDDCLLIMELIDWTRSYPDDLGEISLAYGNDVAWRSFLGNLKSASKDIGKSILPEHLILVADCLSVTGQFVGLSPKGIARQKAQVSVSSPFLLACFNSPGMSFIKAAKHGAADELQGSLEALAWGKVPRLGTGAPFEFLYSGEGHKIDKPVDVYSLLSSQMSTDENNIKIKLPDRQTFTLQRNPGSLKMALQKHISVRDVKGLAYKCKIILSTYGINESLSDVDKMVLLTTLTFHPRRKEKIGEGAVDIKVGHHSEHEGVRCFILERSDGTVVDFSYRKCIHAALEIIDPKRAKSYQTHWTKTGSVQHKA